MAAARGRVNVPASFGSETARMDAMAIERAFAAANPGLRPDMMAVACARGDYGAQVLRELRICLTRDLRRYRTCPGEIARGACRSRSVIVPQGE
jgi:ribonuclease T2